VNASRLWPRFANFSARRSSPFTWTRPPSAKPPTSALIGSLACGLSREQRGIRSSRRAPPRTTAASSSARLKRRKARIRLAHSLERLSRASPTRLHRIALRKVKGGPASSLFQIVTAIQRIQGAGEIVEKNNVEGLNGSSSGRKVFTLTVLLSIFPLGRRQVRCASGQRFSDDRLNITNRTRQPVRQAVN